MNRPFCWVCSLIGTAVAFAAFAVYQGDSKPVYANSPQPAIAASFEPSNS